MEKGVETRNRILNAAMDMVRENGLDSLTIGETAKRVGMSKSGLFAHFVSRDALLLSVIEYTAMDFKARVFDRAMLATKGLERINAPFPLLDQMEQPAHWRMPFHIRRFRVRRPAR